MRAEPSTNGWVRGAGALALALVLITPAFAAAGGADDDGGTPLFWAVAQAPEGLQPERPTVDIQGSAQDGENASDDSTGSSGKAAGGKGDVEEVVVTGSRLQRDNYGGLAPVSTLSGDDFALKGAVSVGDLLRDLPSVGLNGLGATDTNGGRGIQTIDLRDLGAQRTLILVNGRRFVQSSTGASEAVDLNNLPTQLIQRVEVLRDGASTIYGADAVAGVINFILRDDFEGLQLDLSGSGNQRGDGGFGDATLVWGKNFSRGNLTLTGSVSGSRPVGLTDRRFSKRPITSFAPDIDGKIRVTRGFFSGRAGVVRSDDNRALNNTFFTPSGDRSFSSNFLRARDGASIDDQFFISGSNSRRALNGLFTFNFNDEVQFFSELTYVRRDGEQRFSENFLGGGPTVKNLRGFTFPIFRNGDPRNNPFIRGDFLDNAFLDPNGVPLPDDVQMLNITLNRALSEFGPRVFDNKVETFRFASGFKGELPALLGGFNWEIFGNYGRNDDREKLKNDVNLTRALASVQPEVCKQDPKCVVGDFFGTNSLRNTPGALEFIRFDSRDKLRFHLAEFGGSLSGSVIDLPAGQLKAAIGAEYREEDGSATPDRRLVSGDTGGNAREGTRGRQIIREAFFETQLPILRAVPGAEELALEISGRYTDYSSFGGKYLSRYGFSYAPLDMLRFRGVYATSFRSPGISDLFLGKADSFLTVTDRCAGFPDVAAGSTEAEEKLRKACEAVLPKNRFTEDDPFDRDGVNQIRTNVGGNRQVREETSDSVDFGVVFTPPWIENLQFSFDYYNIKIQNPITGQDPQDRVDDCFLKGSQKDCAALQRREDGMLSFVDVPRTNFGNIKTNGYDFGARYTFSLPVVGAMLLDFEGNYVMDFEVNSPSGKESINGQIGSPNFKGRLNALISPRENWQVQATTRFIGKGKDVERRELGLPINSIKSFSYLDLSTAYRFGAEGKYQLTMGMSNALDRDPPRVIDGFSNTSLGTYDPFGRRFFASFRTTFY